jgi:hypothetical protein
MLERRNRIRKVAPQVAGHRSWNPWQPRENSSAHGSLGTIRRKTTAKSLTQQNGFTRLCAAFAGGRSQSKRGGHVWHHSFGYSVQHRRFSVHRHADRTRSQDQFDVWQRPYHSFAFVLLQRQRRLSPCSAETQAGYLYQAKARLPCNRQLLPRRHVVDVRLRDIWWSDPALFGRKHPGLAQKCRQINSSRSYVSSREMFEGAVRLLRLTKLQTWLFMPFSEVYCWKFVLTSKGSERVTSRFWNSRKVHG